MEAPRIVVLSAELANQIAAGEVVERPSSVVKELVENSLDAGARRIVVEVEGGGRKLIRVVDDGSGMSPDDARLSLERHATSKLSSVDDLFRLHTMGFRGEALPSIAGVSRFTLTTRTAASDAACRLTVEGGVIGGARDVGAPVGTILEVRDLLFNVPARLKFLKADSTESGHIHDVVHHLALAHPGVHFKLLQGGRAVLDLPPHGSLLERVRVALGRRGDELCAWEHEESGVRVTAFVGPPYQAQGGGRGTQIFVGRRFVRDRGLSYAVKLGYGELLPSGKTPLALVFLDLGEGQVDVNVHPQKTEVRFARPTEVAAAVRRAVGQGVARAPWLLGGIGQRSPTPQVDHDDPACVGAMTGRSTDHAQGAGLGPPGSQGAAAPGAQASLAGLGPMSELSERFAATQERFLMGWRPLAPAQGMVKSHGATVDEPTFQTTFGAERAASRPFVASETGPTASMRDSSAARESSQTASARDAVPARESSQTASVRDAVPAREPSQTASARDAVPARESSQTASARDAVPARESSQTASVLDVAVARESAAFAASPRFLGQVGPGLLLAEDRDGLLLVDPHLLEEERWMAAAAQGPVPSQHMLMPPTIALSAKASLALQEHQALLAELGCELEPFGGATWALRSAPLGASPDVAVALVTSLVDDLARGLSDGRSLRAHLIGRIACACAIPFGASLSDAQGAELVALAARRTPSPSSHDRPAVMRLSWDELARRGGWG